MAKILVVEDSKSLRTVHGQFLKKSGHDVINAKDGIEAYSLFLDVHPDIILTDNQMPGMTGLELHLLIRNLGFKTPVILITTDGIYLDGLFDELIILRKPINHRKLSLMLEAYCA
jgi:CheY-like chemotaxis protein